MFSTFIFLLLSSTSYTTKAIDIGIGIGIGGGGGGGGGGGSGSGGTQGGLQRCDFVNDKQYQAYLVIQRFKKTITCDPKGKTANWNGPNVCEYNGFRCASPPGSPKTPTIAAVDFNEYFLGAPTISNFVDKLPDLAFFHLNSNRFGGTLPVLSGLKFLYEIDVSNNAMTGRYPDFAVRGLEKQLVFYDFRFNSFSGCVPGSVFNIKLEYLFLNNNQFSSSLPDNLGSTTAKYLTLANNNFTGPIPKSIGKTANTLLEVVFLNNYLSGCLPYEIGFLKKATVFDISANKITGTIPKSFGCLKKIEQLNLANNLLYGEVPEVVCRLPRLLNLTLAGNYFMSLPYACKKLIKRNSLDVRNNCFPGLPKQRSRAECYKFACTHKTCPVHNYVPCKVPCDSQPATTSDSDLPSTLHT